MKESLLAEKVKLFEDSFKKQLNVFEEREQIRINKKREKKQRKKAFRKEFESSILADIQKLHKEIEQQTESPYLKTVLESHKNLRNFCLNEDLEDDISAYIFYAIDGKQKDDEIFLYSEFLFFAGDMEKHSVLIYKCNQQRERYTDNADLHRDKILLAEYKLENYDLSTIRSLVYDYLIAELAYKEKNYKVSDPYDNDDLD
ncbi:hypothetical protein FAZ15_03175 [Sphingobacterium olei]|uniref:Uncharacterized protein n=1 Tax=Sphingobacterium olei TaxID=2571155 RepID=A0A4U0P740_9SPHI|nr:hypothetical protein [Sphingobacterium olei]TJZ63296.1 hypothetical protein FAZ15_03175 [Sphingobacterium olei]